MLHALSVASTSVAVHGFGRNSIGMLQELR